MTVVRYVILGDGVAVRVGKIDSIPSVAEYRIVENHVVERESDFDSIRAVADILILHSDRPAIGEDHLSRIWGNCSASGVLPVADWFSIDSVGGVDDMSIPVLKEIGIYVNPGLNHDVACEIVVAGIRQNDGILGCRDQRVVDDLVAVGVV